jgi:hypothetical protein
VFVNRTTYDIHCVLLGDHDLKKQDSVRVTSVTQSGVYIWASPWDFYISVNIPNIYFSGTDFRMTGNDLSRLPLDWVCVFGNLTTLNGEVNRLDILPSSFNE